MCLHDYIHMHPHSPVSKQEVKVKGAVLLLTVYDHDAIGSNEVCGICVVPCEDISTTEQKNAKLPLFKVPKRSIALKELTRRSDAADVKAREFRKDNRRILHELDEVMVW